MSTVKIPFHRAVYNWCRVAFGSKDAIDRQMRNHRFVEEAIELVQALGCPMEEVIRIAEYVYSRPAGSPHQEVGGSMVTLAALCAANGLDMEHCGDMELERCWDRIEIIRKKHAMKPPFQSEPVPLLPAITLDANPLFPDHMSPEHWHSLSIGNHQCAIYVVKQMDGDNKPYEPGMKVVEFLKKARIPK